MSAASLLRGIRVWLGVVIFGLVVGGFTAFPSQHELGAAVRVTARFPSDAALRARFDAHRIDFERLVAMASEDKHLTRIAPDFTWLDDDVSWPRKDVGISEARWNEYRQLFQRVGAKVGISRSEDSPAIFISIFTQGIVPSGSEKGLVYSRTPLTPVLKSLDERIPDELRDGPDRSHVLVYRPIEDHWYIYYEQW
jgi:hypothetical protein